MSKITVIEINQAIKNLTIELRRKYKLQLPDAIIAASTSFHNLPFLTADKDFQRLEEMNIILYKK